MLTLLFHPEIGDEPGSAFMFILILVVYVLIAAGALYLVIKLIRSFFSHGKSR